MNAPVCPVSRSQPTQKIQPPGIDVDSIPRAHNLITVINAVHRMVNVITKLNRGEPQINNAEPPADYGYPSLKPVPPQYAQMNWVEVYRTYEDQEVVNPEDETQKVAIRTLSTVLFVDRATGHQMLYQAEG